MLVCNCPWTTWQMRQLCRDSGARVNFDTANTRDSFYRSAIQVVLNACSRLTQSPKNRNFHVSQVFVKDWSCIHVALQSWNSNVGLAIQAIKNLQCIRFGSLFCSSNWGHFVFLCMHKLGLHMRMSIKGSKEEGCISEWTASSFCYLSFHNS